MLSKASRLTSGDVEEVLSWGISLSPLAPKGKKSLISARFFAKPGPFRAAIIVPKATAKSAVMRNRLRRAAYRALTALPRPKKGGLAVFFVRSVPDGPLTPAFGREIGIFLDKISVL